MSGWVVLGKISGLYGVKGWVKVFSYTEPRDSIIDYDPVFLNIDDRWQQYRVTGCHTQGKAIVMKFDGIEERTEASALIDCTIAVAREQLAELPADEYYWADLEGLRVVTLDGVELGSVSHLFTTGANDVVVVQGERERLIPFLRPDVIVTIDLEQKLIKVDWDPHF